MIIYRLPINEHGANVVRTKKDYPYSYDGFVLHRLLPNSESTLTLYSDRLQNGVNSHWEECLKKHFNTNGNYFDSFSPVLIEAFLKEFLNISHLKLVLVMEYCNVSNGFPVWRFDVKI